MPGPRLVKLYGNLYYDTKTNKTGTYDKLSSDVKAEESMRGLVDKGLGLLSNNQNTTSTEDVRGRFTGNTHSQTPSTPFNTRVLSFREPTGLQPDFQDYIPQGPQNTQTSLHSQSYFPDNTVQTNSTQDLSVRSSLGRLPNSYEEIDAMLKSGQITRDQADQLELQVTNGPAQNIDQNLDQYGQEQRQDQQGIPWYKAPPINFAGSDLSSELYMLGHAIGSKPGTRGRAATMIGAGGAALFDIARNVASGIGYQKRNQYVNDFYNQQQRRRQYNPVSQTANENGTGNLPFNQMGGTLEVNPRGQWDGKGNYRIPSNDITMQGVDFPVLAMPNVGSPTVMQPGQDYTFPNADYVDEYPMHQVGGTQTTTNPEVIVPNSPQPNPAWDATLEWLNSNPYKVNDKDTLNIDSMELLKTSSYPKYENKIVYIPKAGYFNEEDAKPVQMPEGYKGLPVYLVNGKPVVFDREFNKEFFQLYQDPEGKTREMYPVYGRGVSYRTQQFQYGGTLNGKNPGDDIEFEYNGEIVKGTIKKIENGKLYI